MKKVHTLTIVFFSELGGDIDIEAKVRALSRLYQANGDELFHFNTYIVDTGHCEIISQRYPVNF